MTYSPNPLQSFITCLCLLLLPVWHNLHADSSELQANRIIQALYHNEVILPNEPLSLRIATISKLFLGKPYQLGALGEGQSGRYNQNPLYRTDAFDCETYVDTVIALALARNLNEFKRLLRHIRYEQGRIGFIHRNHFTCLDWNQNNQRQGFVTDITATITNEAHQIVAKNAQAWINKPGWYQALSLSIIQLPNATLHEKKRRLEALKHQGQTLPQQTSVISYIPFTALFNASGQPNTHLFRQIPNGAIIEVIRPNWDMERQIGTHLNVSHLGFAIWKGDVLLFRHATSTAARVMEVPLIDYLREAQKSPSIRGIHLLRVGSKTQHYSANASVAGTYASPKSRATAA